MSLRNLKSRKQSGFTLIEIMIVVLIIGILLAIAVPNFVRARESSRQKSCIANLKQLETAKQQLAMDKKLSGAEPVTTAQVAGDGLYIKKAPVCPSTNAAYVLVDVDTEPVCPNPAIGGADYPHVIDALEGAAAP